MLTDFVLPRKLPSFTDQGFHVHLEKLVGHPVRFAVRSRRASQALRSSSPGGLRSAATAASPASSVCGRTKAARTCVNTNASSSSARTLRSGSSDACLSHAAGHGRRSSTIDARYHCVHASCGKMCTHGSDRSLVVLAGASDPVVHRGLQRELSRAIRCAASKICSATMLGTEFAIHCSRNRSASV
jgi:hypothetical protein